MLERYDLKQLLEDIQEDERVGEDKPKILSQEEIKKMVVAGKKKKGTSRD